MKANTEKTEIALQQASSEVSAFVLDVEAEVKAIEAQYASVVPDASTKEGYDFCKSVRKDVLPVKTGLEKAREQLKGPIIQAGKLIDSNLKPLIDRVGSVYKPFVDAYQEVDNEKKRKEQARLDAIQLSFDEMNNALMQAVGMSSAQLETLIDDLSAFDFAPETFQERLHEAIEHHSSVMQKLSDLLLQTISNEQAQKEQEEQRKRLAEMERREQELKDREAKLLRDQAAQAQREAQAERAKLEQEQIQRDQQTEPTNETQATETAPTQIKQLATTQKPVSEYKRGFIDGAKAFARQSLSITEFTNELTQDKDAE